MLPSLVVVVSRVLYEECRIAGRWVPYLWPAILAVLGNALPLYRA